MCRLVPRTKVGMSVAAHFHLTRTRAYDSCRPMTMEYITPIFERGLLYLREVTDFHGEAGEVWQRLADNSGRL